jgi:subtilase family serine protease
MSRIHRVSCPTIFAIVSLFTFSLAAQNLRQPRITERIDENALHQLAGNTRPEANRLNDRGAVDDSLPLDHMLLQLQRSPQQEDAVREMIDELHSINSPKFHQWLTAEEFGGTYGPAQEDVDKIAAWLESHGFTVNVIYPSGMAIDFSGTAAQVRQAFHTSIHYFEVNGQRHIANASDPQIPAALAPVMAGVVSMHDFLPHSMRSVHRDYTFTSSAGFYESVVPADLATIYDLNPLFSRGYTGAGQTIAVIEDANLYSTSDWYTFRSTFGLSAYSSGSLTTAQPKPASGSNNCRTPGLGSGDDGEAILDAEWASAAAPGASILVAACANTNTTFGGLIAMQNLISNPKPPEIMSISYGECEAENGASSNAAFNALYQQAVAEGISVFVSAGDEGAASCDANLNYASHGIGVSAFASTPYNVAVGGTDFSDSYRGTNATYWSNNNSRVYGSALSYIPEIPWNDSCAGRLLANFFGYPTQYGANSFCASQTANADGLRAVTAGSGGPSGCASGSPYNYGVVGGTCRGYGKPSWQTGVAGIPYDGVRDIPDVSLFAGNGLWGHYYVFCWSDSANGGAPCLGAPSSWAGAGGTSFSSPILAGIQALVNQKQAGPQGNPNYVYYKLAAHQYGVQGSSTCGVSNGPSGPTPGGPSSPTTGGSGAATTSCAFHDVTLGDNVVNCAGSANCYGYGQAGVPDGALSISNAFFEPAFSAATGWDFATGIGSVDAYNLVMNWTLGH